MRIIQIGVPKSGNFWIYNLLQQILSQGDIDQRSFIKQHPIYPVAQTWKSSRPGPVGVDSLYIGPLGTFYQIWPVFREPVDNLDDYVNKTSFVRSHSPYSDNCRTVLSKFDKIIYIIRDPRDIAISMAHYVFTPYIKRHFPHEFPNPGAYLDAHLERLTRQWVQHVGTYLKHQNELNFHVIFYERLLHNFDAELSDLLAYLNIDLSRQAIKAIKTAVDFSTMQVQNPDHLRKGKSGGWKKVMLPVQIKKVETRAGLLLEMLNYPLHNTANTDTTTLDGLPTLPTSLDIPALEKAMIKAQKAAISQYFKRGYAFIKRQMPIINELESSEISSS